MIGSLIGAGLNVGGTIVGGILGSRAARKARARIERQKRENEDWYNRRYNEDATQRADAQRMLTMTHQAIKNRNQAIAGRNAVMGSTDASLAAAQEQNAKALADVTGEIVSQGEKRREEVEDKYLQRKQILEDQLSQIDQGRANTIASAVKGIFSSAGSIARAASGLNNKGDEQQGDEEENNNEQD